MANQMLLDILAKGVEVWNKWRSEDGGAQVVDLRSADLNNADLRSADLRDADLRNADLRSANLSGADLFGGNLSGANLGQAHLHGTNLSSANLTLAKLRQAYLHETILHKAALPDAGLRRADLHRADLSHANLAGADLTLADLRDADLTGADLADTYLRTPWLEGADLSKARMRLTTLAGLDLSQVRGLEEVEHRGPSRISIDTLYRSGGKIPESFLRGCGVPENLLSYLPSLVSPSAIDFYSCFISYSHADKSFARRLHNDLQAQGIRCWLDEHQVLPGDDIMAKVDEGIRIWDKVLLCCSEASLTSWWVASEIDSAFAKERQLMRREKGKRVLSIIPLNLDGYLFSGKWESSGREIQIKQRHAPDFTGWESDNAKYEAQLERIVAALRTDGEGRRPKPEPKL